MKNEKAIYRGFVDLDSGSNPSVIHYYYCGSGPPLFLLHPSPAAANVFLPLLPLLAPHVTAIAIDTPGYGYSDGFNEPAADLQPYVDRLHRFQSALGIKSASLFGSATGTQISVEYAKRYPDACHALILDNIGDFPPQQRDQIMDGYFPDLSADPSGAHLSKVWTMALDVMRFFPWHDHSETARLPAKPISPDVVQATALHFLLAGADYDKAYRPAFMNERAEALMAVPVDTTVIRSAGSILKPFADRLDAHTWPDSISMRHCGASLDERYQTIVDVVKDKTAGAAEWRGSFPQSAGDRRIVPTPGGNVYLRQNRTDAANYLVLHDIGSSADGIQELLASMSAHASVLAPDLPGHGATDVECGTPDDFIADCVGVLTTLLDDANVESFSVLAIGESAPLALSLAAELPERVTQIQLLNPTTMRTTFDPAAVIDGSHLTRLWQALRNDALYDPLDQWTPECALDGEANLSTAYLNQRTLDVLRSRRGYLAGRQACTQFDLNAALAEAQHDVRIFRNANSTDGCRSARSFAAFKGLPSIDVSSEQLVERILDLP